jgi:acid phosphatase (class A)
MKQGFVLIAAAALLTSALAQSPAPASRPRKTLVYLTPEQIDPSRLLAPPVKDGSPAQQEEMAAVKEMIRTRSKERYAQARWDADHEDLSPFAGVIGEGFDLKKLPATAKFLNNVMNDQSMAASTAKDYFRRKFPVTVEMPAAYSEWTCDAYDRKPASRPLRSYPSGHSTLGYSVAVVLANLFPKKATAILERGADYAFSREVCGDHYHSDVDAARVLGTAVGVMVLESSAGKIDLAAARAELQAAHLSER